MAGLLISIAVSAQFDPMKVCRLEDGKLVFRIDNRWTGEQFLEVRKLFDLDSLLIDRALKGDREFNTKEGSWQITRINNNIIEFQIIRSYKRKSERNR